VRRHPVQSTDAMSPIIVSAKNKGSYLATQMYSSSIPLTECTAELSGLDLEQLPDLSDRWWLQSIAASCNKLLAPPMLATTVNLKTLTLAHNRIAQVPVALASSVPNLQVLSPAKRMRTSLNQVLFEGMELWIRKRAPAPAENSLYGGT
jgi:hypothetical protein